MSKYKIVVLFFVTYFFRFFEQYNWNETITSINIYGAIITSKSTINIHFLIMMIDKYLIYF